MTPQQKKHKRRVFVRRMHRANIKKTGDGWTDQLTPAEYAVHLGTPSGWLLMWLNNGAPMTWVQVSP